MPKEYIDKAAAQHAVLHNEGQAAVAAIEAIQPEDVAPVRRGKWIKATLSGAEGYLVCSSCMNCYILPHMLVNSEGKRKLRWCPECGSENDADMFHLRDCSGYVMGVVRGGNQCD
jgi:hypothetical protein